MSPGQPLPPAVGGAEEEEERGGMMSAWVSRGGWEGREEYLGIEGVVGISWHECQWAYVELSKLLHGLLHSAGLPLFLCVSILHHQGAGRSLQG